MGETPDQPRDAIEGRAVLSEKASRRLVLAITIASIITFLFVLIVGTYWPHRFQHPIAKFFVCTLLSFCFSIVMYVIYPVNVRIKKIPFINLPIELAGPSALFVAALALLWYLYPGPPSRFYLVHKGGKPAEFQLQTFELKPVIGSCAYYPARQQTDPYLLGGIYVEFREDRQCSAQIGNSFETHQISFNVLDPSAVIEVKKN